MKQPYYRQHPQYEINGFTLSLNPWSFSCGALNPNSPDFVKIDLPEVEIDFGQGVEDEIYLVYISPSSKKDKFTGKNHYRVIGISDKPEPEKFGDFSIIPALIVTVPASGNEITVRANIMDPGEWHDPNPQEITGRTGKIIKSMSAETVLGGWERLHPQKHPDCFPVQGLGQLKPGESWFVEVGK